MWSRSCSIERWQSLQRSNDEGQTAQRSQHPEAGRREMGRRSVCSLQAVGTGSRRPHLESGSCESRTTSTDGRESAGELFGRRAQVNSQPNSQKLRADRTDLSDRSDSVLPPGARRRRPASAAGSDRQSDRQARCRGAGSAARATGSGSRPGGRCEERRALGRARGTTWPRTQGTAGGSMMRQSIPSSGDSLRPKK
jgi:hypothetical protein